MEREDKAGSERTRLSLIEAGMHFFGLRGYEAASTREIAGLAKANIAAIAYHFGGKEGLRKACAEHVAATIRSVAGGALPGATGDVSADPEVARRQLVAFLRQVARFMLLEKRARMMARFMMRELADPSIALDIVYSAVVSPTHSRLCALWGAATGLDPQSEQVKLSVFSIVGQVFYFRIGQDVVTRKMEWPEYGEAQVAAISDVLIANLEAAVVRDRAVAGRLP